MTQPDLFTDWPAEPPSVAGSDTSVAAAKRIESRAAAGRRRVLDWFRSRGEQGGTDEEGITALGMNPSTFRPRRIELVDDGWLKDSGDKRQVRSGNKATVWTVTGKALT